MSTCVKNAASRRTSWCGMLRRKRRRNQTGFDFCVMPHVNARWRAVRECSQLFRCVWLERQRTSTRVNARRRTSTHGDTRWRALCESALSIHLSYRQYSVDWENCNIDYIAIRFSTTKSNQIHILVRVRLFVVCSRHVGFFLFSLRSFP